MDTLNDKKEIPSDIYTKNYYLTDNEGCWEYQKGLDTNIHEKFTRALGLANIKDGDHVLDIGCGRGELVYYSVKKGANAIGIDYAHDAITIAKQTIQLLPQNLRQNADVFVADVVKHTFPHKFNVVFMIDVAEHLFDWQLIESFAKINSILAEDGRLIIVTPNYYYDQYLSPLKRFFDIPFKLIKISLRILRGKYKPKNAEEVYKKIFLLKPDRGEVNRMMHANVMTPPHLKNLLKNFNTTVYCEDHSVNPLTFLLKKWWGLHIVAIAKKKI